MVDDPPPGWIPDISSGCFWFTNFTFIPGERTLDPSVRSAPQLEEYGDTTYDTHPGMAPGTAPVFSPCGALGGNPYGWDNQEGPQVVFVKKA